MAQKPRVLIVEDTLAMSRLYAEYLKATSCTVECVATAAEARKALRERLPDVVVLDLQLPDANGLDILRDIKADGMPTQAVVVTANGSINMAVEAMRSGAFDFIVKPFNADRLNVTVRNAIERQRLTAKVETYEAEFARDRFYSFIGESLVMQAVYRVLQSAARSKATVFVTGESGTGKELCAEAIHKASGRRERPLIALNCAAIPRDLLESELFGHVKGAFTGATADREGAALQANGGSLFLDEICEMDMALQSKLLRFLQTGIVQRVGSSRQEPVDVRIICATNRDPTAEVRAGRFREDLFYRLHVVPVHLPPLREREDDVILIAREFLKRFAEEEGRKFAAFAPEAEAALRQHEWPGNVRELQNAVRNVVVLHDGETVTADMLPPLGSAPRAAGAAPGPAAARPPRPQPTAAGGIRPLAAIEREAIEAAIEACNGNVPKAAALLDVSPSTIYRKRLAWEAGG
ncbi:MAG: sigma-54-dependent Fis family transcriptional regulator [Alphaproteobacteria bacterium]|nr:sigma-54-dependent Fis family transcriptional regulator [Alphaproteobacteria bacterium]